MKSFTQITTVLFGLLTGGMVLMALGLIPYWRSLEPADFTEVFASSLPTVGRTMVILTILSTGTIVAAAGLAAWKRLPSRNLLIAGAASALIMLVTVPIYFGTANPLLASGTLEPSEIAIELAKWQKMHWFRTTVGVIGLFCTISAGYSLPKNT